MTPLRIVHTKRLRHKRYVDAQNGYATNLPVTVSVKKIKGAAHQRYGDGGGIVWCEETFSLPKCV